MRGCCCVGKALLKPKRHNKRKCRSIFRARLEQLGEIQAIGVDIIVRKENEQMAGASLTSSPKCILNLEIVV